MTIKVLDNLDEKGSKQNATVAGTENFYSNVVSTYIPDTTTGTCVIHTPIGRSANIFFYIKVTGFIYSTSAVIDFAITGEASSVGTGSIDSLAGAILNYAISDNGNDELSKYVGIDANGNLAIALGDIGTVFNNITLSVNALLGNSTTNYTTGWSIDQTTTSNFGWKDKHGSLIDKRSVRRGGTGSDMSGTGGTNYFVAQGSVGGSFGSSPVDFSYLTGQIAAGQVAANIITDLMVATGNKDGVAGTYSMRTLGTGSQQACAGNDSRLSDARIPTAHHTTHQSGGTDEIATATAAANAIPKANSNGTLAPAWLPNAYNYLINGGWWFAQRQAPGTLTAVSSASYSADRWKVEWQTTGLQYIRVDTDGALETGITERFYGKFTKITNAAKFIIYQPIENKDTLKLASRKVVFQTKLKASASKTIKIGVIQLTSSGTSDTIPSPIISTYNANTTDPTLVANLSLITPDLALTGTISGSAVSCSVTTSWQNFGVAITMPSNAKNLILAIWTDSQFSVADTLSIAESELVADTNGLSSWNPQSYVEEIYKVKRYCYKTFGLDIAPAQNAGRSYDIELPQIGAASTLQIWTGIRHPVTMFKATPTVTFYSPSSASAQVRDESTGADCSATQTANLTNEGFGILTTPPAGSAAANTLSLHFLVDAEM